MKLEVFMQIAQTIVMAVGIGIIVFAASLVVYGIYEKIKEVWSNIGNKNNTAPQPPAQSTTRPPAQQYSSDLDPGLDSDLDPAFQISKLWKSLNTAYDLIRSIYDDLRKIDLEIDDIRVQLRETVTAADLLNKLVQEKVDRSIESRIDDGLGKTIEYEIGNIIEYELDKMMENKLLDRIQITTKTVANAVLADITEELTARNQTIKQLSKQLAMLELQFETLENRLLQGEFPLYPTAPPTAPPSPQATQNPPNPHTNPLHRQQGESAEQFYARLRSIGKMPSSRPPVPVPPAPVPDEIATAPQSQSPYIDLISAIIEAAAPEPEKEPTPERSE